MLVGVQHPFSDQTKEQIRGKAEDVFEATVSALVNVVVVDGSKVVAGGEEAEEEECSA